MEQETTRSAPDGYPAKFEESHTSVDRELSGLLNLLHGVRKDMASALMVKAARITGTVEDLRLTVQRLDTAIQAARDVTLLLEARGSRSRSNIQASPGRQTEGPRR